jgi:hypothetical protein
MKSATRLGGTMVKLMIQWSALDIKKEAKARVMETLVVHSSAMRMMLGFCMESSAGEKNAQQLTFQEFMDAFLRTSDG